VDNIRENFENENELENFVFEERSLNRFFSEDRLFLGKESKKLIKTKVGIGTIPDGILLDIENSNFFIIENELMIHDVFKHIVRQIIKFVVSIRNKETITKLRDVFMEIIMKNKEKYFPIFEKYGVEQLNIYSELENILENEPQLYIFIDEINDDLSDFCSIIQDSINIKIIKVLKFKENSDYSYQFDDMQYRYERGGSKPIIERRAPEKYNEIFNKLIENFKKERPESTKRGSSRDSWLEIPIGTTGFGLIWNFIGNEPKKELEIYINFGHKNFKVNHEVFEFFVGKEKEFKDLLLDELLYEEHYLKSGEWDRILISKEIGTLDKFIEDVSLQDWALKNILIFYDFYMENKETIQEIVRKKR